MRSRTRYLVMGGLVVAAFGLRLAFILDSLSVASQRTPLPGLDADVYWHAARDLRQGADTSFDLMLCSAPAFAYLLAGLQWLLGESMTACRVAIAALASLRVLPVYALVRRLGGRDAPAVVAGALAAALPSLVYFDGSLLKTSFELTWLALLLWLLAGLPAPATRLAAVARGLLVGALLSLSFLSQLGTFLYVVPVVGYLAIATGWPRRARLLALAPALATFALVSTLFHLSAASRDAFLPRAGVELYLGQRPEAKAYYRPLPDQPSYPYGHLFVARELAEQAVGRPLTAAEADRYYRDRAWAFVSSRPLAAARLALAKGGLFLNDLEPKAEDYLPYLSRRARVLAMPLGFGALVALAPLGAIALWGRGRRRELALLGGVLLAVLATNLLTFVTWRSRVPAVLPLIPLAGVGVVELVAAVARLRAGLAAVRLRAALVPALATTAAIWVAYRPVATEAQARWQRAASANDRASASAELRLRRLGTLEARSERSRGQELERAHLLASLQRHDEAYRLLRDLDAHDDVWGREQLDRYQRWLDGVSRR